MKTENEVLKWINESLEDFEKCLAMTESRQNDAAGTFKTLIAAFKDFKIKYTACLENSFTMDDMIEFAKDPDYSIFSDRKNYQLWKAKRK